MSNTLFTCRQMRQGKHHLYDDIGTDGNYKTRNDEHDEEFN